MFIFCFVNGNIVFTRRKHLPHRRVWRSLKFVRNVGAVRSAGGLTRVTKQPSTVYDRLRAHCRSRLKVAFRHGHLRLATDAFCAIYIPTFRRFDPHD
jgi:hypothetical protein